VNREAERHAPTGVGSGDLLGRAINDMKTETPRTEAFLEAWKLYMDSSLNRCPGSMADFARQLECELNTQKELTACADKNIYDLVAFLSGKMPDTYNARVKEIADGFLKRAAAMPNEKS
jgi:hypothetical protein